MKYWHIKPSYKSKFCNIKYQQIKFMIPSWLIYIELTSYLYTAVSPLQFREKRKKTTQKNHKGWAINTIQNLWLDLSPATRGNGRWSPSPATMPHLPTQQCT